MEILNTGNDLFVTFTNLKKSDTNTYYCGVERNGPDPWIKVNLKVTDATSYCPKRTPDTVDTFTTLSSAVSNISTLSSNNKHNITDVSASNTTLNTPTHSAPATQAAGSVPYLIAGLICTFALVMVVLLLTRKLMKRGQTLSFVEMKPLNIRGCVGERVTFTCSDWNNVFGVRYNAKYFCRSPCTEDKHIIIKAAPGKTTQQNRMEILNTGNDLFVTFTNLKKSDANTYYCGVERNGPDPWIKVNLKVTDGSIPYLIIGVILIITILMVLLKFMSKKMMKQRKVVSTAVMPQEDAREKAEYDEIRHEEATDPDSLYANNSFLQDIGSAAAGPEVCSSNSSVLAHTVSHHGSPYLLDL
ncbi:CMRF35-like molecule 5 [Dissostichus eleginoides]|uniref:CMRF35-like molecule 5 n=1 Tax=Dissostichus eleginoides TaxID=100907 RepID=A0AAD9C7M3_DISEL|nr:CMRF35-like molecule 5 [Dissostichus eleginoides]